MHMPALAPTSSSMAYECFTESHMQTVVQLLIEQFVSELKVSVRAIRTEPEIQEHWPAMTNVPG